MSDDKVVLLFEREVLLKRLDTIEDRFHHVVAAWMLSAEPYKQEQMQRALDKMRDAIYEGRRTSQGRG